MKKVKAPFIIVASAIINTLTPFNSRALAATENTEKPTALIISASVGPLRYLSGAQVTVTNAQNQVVGQTTTNTRGAALINLSSDALASLPFKISTSGGKIIYQYDDMFTGPQFSGHLRGEIGTIPPGQITLSYLDLVSTTAAQLKSNKVTYEQGINKTRAILGIGKAAPMDILQYSNNHVDWSRLDADVKRHSDFDKYVKYVAAKAISGKYLTYLQPRPNNIKDYSGQASSVNASGTNSVYYNAACTPAVGNSYSNGGGSTEKIVNVALDTTQLLLTVAGQKNLAEGLGMAAGMLMTGKSSGSSSEQALLDVQNQLVCISQQINYLQEQMGELQLTTNVNTASACTAAITTGYDQYKGLVNLALPAADGTPSSSPLDSSNKNVAYAISSWESTGAGTTACGQSINQSLFGTGGGQKSSWRQLNINYQNANMWYSQVQVQELQQFLAWWSMKLYENFVLTTEVYNYRETFDLAYVDAGSDNWSSTVCTAGSTNESANYCVWRNNILAAYPGDLYSDEAGIPGTGQAVNVIPGATSMPEIGTTWPSLDTKYMIQYFTKQEKISAFTYDDIALNYANSLGINPEGLGSGVETFTNPQAPHASAQLAQVDILNQPGPPGPWTVNTKSNASEFFLYQVNQSPSSPWKNVNSKYISFYSRENVSTLYKLYYTNYSSFDVNLKLKTSVRSPKEFRAGTACNSNKKNYTNCNNYDPTYYVGILQQRIWWPSAASATTYTPPQPPVP